MGPGRTARGQNRDPRGPLAVRLRFYCLTRNDLGQALDRHAHACLHGRVMRTTVEITDGQRAALLRLAATRGQKGFSFLVREAIERYLTTEEETEVRRRADAAVHALGTLSEESADHMQETVGRIRRSWR